MRSENLIPLALIAQKEILSSARARAPFVESLALSLALSKQWAPLNFALIFKNFHVVFNFFKLCIFSISGPFQRSLFKGENRIQKVFGKYVKNILLKIVIFWAQK